MGNYGDSLRRERRSELAIRTLPPEMINEYGEVFLATKTEAGKAFGPGDYAYVPDPSKPSTWKLRLTNTPGGDPDPQIVGAAIAALGKGFRGNKVQIPDADLSAVKAKVKAAWLKANPEKDKKEMPATLASVDLEEFYNHNHGKGGLFVPGGGGSAGGGVGGKASIPKEKSTGAERKAVAKESGQLYSSVLSASGRKAMKATRDQMRTVYATHKDVYKEGGPYANATSKRGTIKISELNSTNLKSLSDKQLSSLHNLAKTNQLTAAVYSRTLPTGVATLLMKAYGRSRFDKLTPQITRLQAEMKSRKISFTEIDITELNTFFDDFIVFAGTLSDTSTADLNDRDLIFFFLNQLQGDVQDDPDAPAGLVGDIQKAIQNLPAVTASGELLLEMDSEVIVACGDDNDLELSVKIDDISATPNDDVSVAVSVLVEAAKIAYAGYDISCDVDIDVDDQSTEAADSYTYELDIDLDGISQTPSEAVKAAFNNIISVVKSVYGDKVDVEVEIDVDSRDIQETAVDPMDIKENTVAYDDAPMEAPMVDPYDYNTEGTEEFNVDGVNNNEFGTLPPALKAALVKKLTAQLAKEKDPAKQAAIKAKIKKYS